MKRLIAFLIFLPFSTLSQNLVSNGSFEQISCGSPHITLYNFCDWVQPPNALKSPDGFKDSGFVNCFACGCLPGQSTFAGNTFAFNGQYFAGVLGYYVQGGQVNARECIQTELAQPLILGQNYQIGFSVKFGSRSKYLIDHFGMILSNTAIEYPLFNGIPINPQLDINGQLGDSLNWTTLSTTYTAIGGERFITIGNFTPDSLLSVTINPAYDLTDTSCLLARFGSYFFIDSVFIFNNSPTSISKIEKPHLYFYPNPFNSFTTIQFETTHKNADLNIYNLLGLKMKTMSHISTDKIIISRDNLPTGIYFVRMTVDNKIIATEKLVITDK